MTKRASSPYHVRKPRNRDSSSISAIRTRHRRARTFCQKHAVRPNLPHVLGCRAPARQRPSSERSCTSRVRHNPRGVCVARWYDPGTGQFMSVDPDLAETGQPYVYTGDDLVNLTDPLGLTTFPAKLVEAEFGGLGKYEANIACTSAQKCNVEWFLSLKPPFNSQAITYQLYWQGVVDRASGRFFEYNHLEDGSYQWHGLIQPVPYGVTVHVHLLLYYNMATPDAAYLTGTQLWVVRHPLEASFSPTPTTSASLDEFTTCGFLT
jgi:hypothetical protein